MTIRQKMTGCGLAALIAVSYVAYVRYNRSPTTPTAIQGATKDGGATKASAKSATATERSVPAEAVVHISATVALASVNGRELKLANLIPLNLNEKTEGQDFSPVTYRYLLDRAVNRELILQTAKAQGVALDASQIAQLAEFRRERSHREPGLVEQLILNEAQINFEIRDAEAFILQTSLLAKMGASPDVSSEDVTQYYNLHAGEYSPLPTVEPARNQAWADIEYQIRNLLAPTKRAQFQIQLVSYMDQIKSAAKIVEATQ